jgi:MFS family permease
MGQVLVATWALLLGMLLLMLGNGMQGTLLGIRGGLEGFSTFQMSIVMSGYFVGFLGGSRLAPELIRRVGHVRVFAALGSFISAIIILYPSITDPWVWFFLRVFFGFCFSGVYVTAESWLNNSVDNTNRGKALSLYLIVQMAGLVAAQQLLRFGDPSGFVLFVIPSVLVSIAFAPILLSATTTPRFETSKPMSLRRLYATSPLGCVSIFLLGLVFSAQFGMSPVYGSEVGFSVVQIANFISAIFIGGLLLQYPIGWMSDRMDRRLLILGVAFVGGVASLVGFLFGSVYAVVLGAAFVSGGMANPLYALVIAYTNDFLEGDDMAAASGGLIFLNGVGAIFGPILTGTVMDAIGPSGFWLMMAVFLTLIGLYAAWRMTRRPNPVAVGDTAIYTPVAQTATPIAFEAAQEVYADLVAETVADEATIQASNDPTT